MRNFVFLIVLSALTACSPTSRTALISSPLGFANQNQTNLIKASNEAGDQLSKLPADLSEVDKPVLIMTTLVNSDNLLKSSTLGRTTSEIIAGRMAQNGFPIREIRLRSDILVKGNQGELILSREIKEVAKQQNAQAVIVGTYAEAAKSVFVSTKLIRLSDERILSAHNFSIDKTDDIATLLHGVRLQDQYPVDENAGEFDSSSNVKSNGSDPDTLMDSIRSYDKKMNEKRMNRKL